VIVTTYDQVMSSKRICFVGTAADKPLPKTLALLSLVYQSQGSKASFDDWLYLVKEEKKNCNKAKHNIVSSTTTSYHHSCGNVFGFGS